MSKPSPDPVYVRASVWPRCDLRCCYCPIDEGMENRVPKVHAGASLTTTEYLRNLRAIADAGVPGLSLTGGEPTLRPDLSEIITGARPHYERLELTTNGVRLARFADVVKANIDLLKVSLDSADEATVADITGGPAAFAHARHAIEWAVASDVRLGVNVVLMRRTIADLDRTIDFVRALARQAREGQVYLSLLDFYYTPSRRAEWLREFVPTSSVLSLLTDRYGRPAPQARFGCRFYWFDAGGLSVRLKDSFSATMRADKCRACHGYCQEGIFGVKHSVEGWFTTCPSNRETNGVHLAGDLTDGELTSRIKTVLSDVESAAPVRESFHRMCATHELVPAP